MTMLIEVASTEPPKNGKKLARVTTVTGQAFDVWPDKLAALRVGGLYTVEFAEREFNGRTYRKITKALPAANGRAHPAAGDPQGTNGHARPANGAAPAPAAHQPSDNAEWLFVRELLTAGVRAGAVSFSAHELRTAIAMLRNLWRDVGR